MSELFNKNNTFGATFVGFAVSAVYVCATSTYAHRMESN